MVNHDPAAASQPPRRVCVYCASSLGTDPGLAAMAADVGTVLAQAGCEVVYGGGAVGLMGTVADAALAAGGTVTGIIPTNLFSREVAHRGLTTLIEVDSMHERKRLMFERSDAFVALPGGFGTLEELIEIATWSQIGVHDKPIVVINHDDYFAPLFDQIDRAVTAGLMRSENRDIIGRIDRPDQLLAAINTYERLAVPKWID